jgi:hypothetical protein
MGIIHHHLNGTDMLTSVMLPEHKQYLDTLRETGVTNMFGARPYLMDEFPDLTKRLAQAILLEWMETFNTE